MKKTLVLMTSALLVAFPSGVAAGGGCGGDATSQATDQVVLKHACFAPTLVRVSPGTEVRFVNADPIPHYVTGAHNQWGSEELQGGDTYAHTFTQVGVFPYSCSLHFGMTGVVVVEGEGVSARGAPEISDRAGHVETSGSETKAPLPEQGRVLAVESTVGSASGLLLAGTLGALALFVLFVRRVVRQTG